MLHLFHVHCHISFLVFSHDPNLLLRSNLVSGASLTSSLWLLKGYVKRGYDFSSVLDSHTRLYTSQNWHISDGKVHTTADYSNWLSALLLLQSRHCGEIAGYFSALIMSGIKNSTRQGPWSLADSYGTDTLEINPADDRDFILMIESRLHCLVRY